MRLAQGFLTLYTRPLTVANALEKSATLPAEQSRSLNIVRVPRGENGKPDYSLVQRGQSVWVEIRQDGHPLHGRHVLVTKGPHGFVIAHGDDQDMARGTDEDVLRRQEALAQHEEETARKERKEREKKVKEDEAGGIFGFLAGIRRREDAAINSPWPDEDEDGINPEEDLGDDDYSGDYEDGPYEGGTGDAATPPVEAQDESEDETGTESPARKLERSEGATAVGDEDFRDEDFRMEGEREADRVWWQRLLGLRKSRDVSAEPRDGHGRWVNEGWKPFMSEQEAKDWASDSAIKDPLFHVTKARNVPSILKYGLQVGTGEAHGLVAGPGIYLAMDPKTVKFYNPNADLPTLTVYARVHHPLEVRVGANEIKTSDVPRIEHGADEGEENFWSAPPLNFERLVAKRLSGGQGDKKLLLETEVERISHLNHRLEREAKKRFPGVVGKESEALLHQRGTWMEENGYVHTQGEINYASLALRNLLEREGYDSVVIRMSPKAKREAFDVAGGNQVVALRPDEVTVVKSAEAEPIIGLYVLDPRSVTVASITKSHDVSNEPRLPKGDAHGGEWTKLGGSPQADEQPANPPLAVGDKFYNDKKRMYLIVLDIKPDGTVHADVNGGIDMFYENADRFYDFANDQDFRRVSPDEDEAKPRVGDTYYSDLLTSFVRVKAINPENGNVTVEIPDGDTELSAAGFRKNVNEGDWTKRFTLVPAVGDEYRSPSSGQVRIVTAAEPYGIILSPQPGSEGSPWEFTPITFQRALNLGMISLNRKAIPPSSAPSYPRMRTRYHDKHGMSMEVDAATFGTVGIAFPDGTTKDIPIDSWPDFLRLGEWEEDGAQQESIAKVGRDLSHLEDWQLTKEEYGELHPGDSWKHNNIVFWAIMDGKDVPENVLADYPGLKQRAKHFNLDSAVRRNPQPGTEIRINNPLSPDYGRRFRVTAAEPFSTDAERYSAKVTMVKLSKDGTHEVGLPFKMSVDNFAQLLPYNPMGSNYGEDSFPDAGMTPSFERNDSVAAVYLPGDPDLPDPKGEKIDYYGIAAGKLVDPQAQARKDKVVDQLTTILANDKDFVEHAVRIGAATDQEALDKEYYRAWGEDGGKLRQQIEGAKNGDPAAVRKYVYDRTNTLVRTWAQTSANSSYESLGIQRAAMEEFALDPAETRMPWVPSEDGDFRASTMSAGDTEPFERDYQINKWGYRSFVRAEYTVTQDFLRHRGIKELRLYRGYNDFSDDMKDQPDGSTEERRLQMQPLSSFSTSEGVARVFPSYASDGYGRLVSVVVPAKDIVSLALTGAGCLVEREAIVAGRPLRARVTKVGFTDAVWRHGQNGEEPVMTNEWDEPIFGKSFTLSGLRPLDVDARLENADWTKTYWDLPPYGSREFVALMRSQRVSPRHFRELPVAKFNSKRLRSS